MDFLISRNRILDIEKSIFWYQEIDFLISIIIFLDIKKYLINSKTAPQNTFPDIKKSISWYQEMISWYQEFNSFISRNVHYFLISRNRILDIKKFISWYQEMYFLISSNRILDIKKCWINSKTALHWNRPRPLRVLVAILSAHWPKLCDSWMENRQLFLDVTRYFDRLFFTSAKETRSRDCPPLDC